MRPLVLNPNYCVGFSAECLYGDLQPSRRVFYFAFSGAYQLIMLNVSYLILFIPHLFLSALGIRSGGLGGLLRPKMVVLYSGIWRLSDLFLP